MRSQPPALTQIIQLPLQPTTLPLFLIWTQNALPQCHTLCLANDLSTQLSPPSLALFATCPTTPSLASAAQHPILHHQQTIPATESTIDRLTQEGQFSKHLGGVMMGYVLGLECPKPNHCLTRPIPQGSACCCHSFFLVTLFSVVMDS